MVYGNPISNRFQIYSLKYFSYPKSSTCSAILNSGFFGKLIFENTIWPNYFCNKYYIALYTWHDHWEEVWGKEMNYRRWSCVDFKEHMKNTKRKPTPNKSQIMQKFLLVQISCFNNANEMLQNAGCDRPTPLTRISSPGFLN